MTAIDLASPGVVLTDRAAKRVSRILSKEPEGTVLRISVAGGGCSGFQYEYNLVQEKPASDDIVLSKGDAVVLIGAVTVPLPDFGRRPVFTASLQPNPADAVRLRAPGSRLRSPAVDRVLEVADDREARRRQPRRQPVEPIESLQRKSAETVMLFCPFRFQQIG